MDRGKDFKDFKHEFKVNTQRCQICLSVGRKLSPLGPYVDILKKIITQPGYWNTCNMESVEICWECSSFLFKIQKFQIKVLKAIEILNLGQTYYNSLSNLTSVILTDSGSKIIPTEDNKQPVETKSETIDSDLKECDDGNISDDFAQTMDLDCIKTEIKTEEKKKKVKNPEWVKEKALLNKKPKFKVITDYKEIFRKVKINSDELKSCLESERYSRLFKLKKYKCQSCILGFGDENSLAGHVKKCHSQSLSYTCDVCLTRTSTKHKLVQHIAGHYYKYECVLCAYSCYHRQNRLAHWKTHRRPVKCVSCELKFGLRRDFFKHYKEWHENYICDHCGVSFKMRYCIKKHIRKQHGPFECKRCDKIFSRYHTLWIHNKVQHSSAPPAGAYCVECDRRFADERRYKWHLANGARHRARPPRRIPCPDCDKVFTKRMYMRDHYDMVHLGKYKYRCEQCDKYFSRKAGLNKHIQAVHLKVPKPKNKLCSFCGRGFSHARTLLHHVRTHTGERPHACPHCPAAFAQPYPLRKHLATQHPGAPAILAEAPSTQASGP